MGMRKTILAGAFLIAGCTAGLPPTGGSAPYVSRYPEPIDVTIPDNAPSITQQFRAPDTQSAAGKAWGEHQGLDVHAPLGTPVIAAAPGEVIQSYLDPAYGHTVMLSHGGSPAHWTRYTHLASRTVSEGDRLKRGQALGTLGKSGVLAGGFLHLHFEVWEKPDGGQRTAIDPHLKWAGGVGKVTCFTGRNPRGAFKLTYPVPCE